jgi:hypothetical protein
MPEEHPKRVFISHTNREPDLSLAREIHARIRTAGHHSFMAAESLELGDKWSEITDLELRQCDYFVLLLSPESAVSDMVAEEIRRAKKLYDTRGDDDKRPQILPIHLGSFQDTEARYGVVCNTFPFQHIDWRSDSDTERVVEAILGAIGKHIESRPPAVGLSLPLSQLGTATNLRLTVNFHKSCVRVLRQCWELSDRHTLQALFAIYPLSRYLNAIPLEAQSQVQLIEALIHNLVTYPGTKGQPLLELLSTLRDKREPTEPDWTDLNELWRQLDERLRSKT